MQLDFSQFASRLKSAKASRLQMNPLLEGDWPAVFCGFSLQPSRAGNEMVTMIWRCKPDDQTSPMFNRELKLRYVLSTTTEFQLDNLLMVLHDLGIDVKTITSSADWARVLNTLEEQRPKRTINIKRQEDDPRYCKFYVKEEQKAAPAAEKKAEGAVASPKKQKKQESVLAEEGNDLTY
jgi:hypothetical protein